MPGSVPAGLRVFGGTPEPKGNEFAFFVIDLIRKKCLRGGWQAPKRGLEEKKKENNAKTSSLQGPKYTTGEGKKKNVPRTWGGGNKKCQVFLGFLPTISGGRPYGGEGEGRKERRNTHGGF